MLKSVLPEHIVVADIVPSDVVPLTIKLFNVAADMFTDGLLAVPPVYVFVPGCTLVVLPAVVDVANISYKFVLPDIIVVAEIVCKLVAPLAVNPFIDGDAAKLTTGLFPVPPVVMLLPGWTLVMSFAPADVANMSYRFVLPDIIVVADNVVADKVGAFTVPVKVAPLKVAYCE